MCPSALPCPSVLPCPSLAVVSKRIYAILHPLLILLLFLGACETSEPVQERVWHEEAGYRWAALPVPADGAPGFERLPGAETGITFANTLTEESFLANQHTANGSGVALGDVDSDGWVDIYLARLDGSNALYRNLGGWRFEEITDSAGVTLAHHFSTGAAFADVDGDADLDLLVTMLGGPNALFLNDGNGRFQDATEAAGLTSERGSTSMALADMDGDGDLDFYVGNYKKSTVRDLYPPAVRDFDRVVVRDGEGYAIIPEFQEHYGLRVQGNRLMRYEIAEPDAFYLNDGAGHFTEVSFTGGRFLNVDGQPLQEAPQDWALAVRFQDVNGDGWPDLYVCNDFESPDHFWLNQGDGTFRAAPRLALRKTSHSTMSVDFADLNRDGAVDFFLADMLSREHKRRQRQVGQPDPEPAHIGDINNRPQQVRNSLLLSRGDGTFAEIANASGVAASEWTWSSLFMDVDLDGYDDLLLSNGHAYDAMDADTQERTGRRPPQGDWRRVLLEFPDLDLHNLAFRNLGGEVPAFEAMPQGWGLGMEPDVAHGMALADLDNDGDLDVVMNRLNAEAGIYRNTTAAPRLAIRLRGAEGNTQGIGAQIRVSGGGLPVQTREVIEGGSYLSDSDTQYTFAAGTIDGQIVDSLRIEVIWRGGSQSVIDPAVANRIYEINQTNAVPADTTQGQSQKVVYFEEASLAHTHTEAPYEDFARQPLLPYRLSQQGPAIAWGDLDDDGDDDLVIGSGRGGTLAVFRNQENQLTRLTGSGVLAEPAPFDQTGIVILPRPEAGALVFIGISNYERGPRDAPRDSEIAVYAFENGHLRLVEKLPFGPDSIGPLALGDLDGDGNLDLFAGGRHVPGQYPAAASSRIYFQEADGFELDAQRNAVFANIGMVSGVGLGDLDGDGDQDIVLATEWGAVRLFLNQGDGRFEDATNAFGLAEYTGRWNGIALGDFDADGRLDLVATNAGWNTEHGRWHGETEHPLRLYGSDFDGNGIFDGIEAHYEPAMAAYVPDRKLSVLGYAMPYLRRRTPTHTQFAASTLEELIGPSLTRASYAEATTLASMVFLNRGDHFEAHPLPAEAQLAPAFSVNVADMDGDGHDDLFLSQNFFALPDGVSRQDAGRGLWLRGDGAGGFSAVPGHQTGVMVYGEQRAAALSDYDRDGRIDLVVSQNGAATKLYRNIGGAPGLRVRLAGPPGNEAGVGAMLRVQYADGSLGPARLLAAGSGYWSQSSLETVLGVAAAREVQGVWVRWPDGREQEVAVAPGTQEVIISYADRPS